MRRLVLVVALLLAGLCAGWTWDDDSAHAAGGNPAFDRLSTLIAGRPSAILCVPPDEDPNLSDAWGYTYLAWDYAVVDSDLCDALSNELYGHPAEHDTVPPPPTFGGAHRLGRLARCRTCYAADFGTEWQVANAVLVVAHESFHVRRWALRGSESAVECRAIRHARSSSLILGFSEERSWALLPWQLAFHWRIGVLAPVYASPGCNVPWPY